MKDGTEDFVQVREFEITCDSPMFPHQQNKDESTMEQDQEPREK